MKIHQKSNFDPNSTPKILLTRIRILTRIKNWQQQKKLNSKKVYLFHIKIFSWQKSNDQTKLLYIGNFMT